MSRQPFVVVPTLGNRDSLWPLLRGAEMPVVVVWTNREKVPPRWAGTEHPHITWVVDLGPIDIHRWWLAGLAPGASANYGPAVIVNDDVQAAPGELRYLADQVEGETVLAYLDRPEHAATRCTPITGWCFAINPWRILPPEPSVCTRAYTFPPGEWGCTHHSPQLRWWYGDHEIEMRAKHYPGRSVVAVPGLEIEHLRTDWWYDRQAEITPLIRADRALFRKRHPELEV